MIVYMIKNLINNKVYVGITTKTLKMRKRTHKNAINTKNTPLYASIKKHGWRNFKFKQLMKVKTKEELFLWEKHFINHFHSTMREFGYNLTSGGEFNKPSIEGRKRISQKLKRRWAENKEYRLMMENLHKKEDKKVYIKKGPRKHLKVEHKQKIAKKLENNKNRLDTGKKIKCIDLDKTFDNINEVRTFFPKGNIYKAIKNGTKSNGYYWEFV